MIVKKIAMTRIFSWPYPKPTDPRTQSPRGEDLGSVSLATLGFPAISGQLLRYDVNSCFYNGRKSYPYIVRRQTMDWLPGKVLGRGIAHSRFLRQAHHSLKPLRRAGWFLQLVPSHQAPHK